MGNNKLTKEQRARAATKHGKSFSRVYSIWRGMLRRCLDSREPGYKNYGARGIGVCNRWLSFSNFYEDLGDPPPRHSLDRINNNASYSKDNCRWASGKQQSNNKRSNKVIYFKGKRFTLAQAADHVGLERSTFWRRIHRGWSVDDAMTIPLKKR